MTTLAEWHDEYVALIAEGLTSNTVASYGRAWRHRLAPTLGALDLVELTPLKIAKARESWDGASSTKTDALALLRRLLELAVLDQQIPANPCRSLPRARSKADDPDPVARALTPVQVARMLDLTKDTPNGQRTLAGLVYTGLRLGELVGLRWQDVDTDAGLLTVRRTFSPDGNGKLVERPTKSGRVRSVPILEELQPWLTPNDFDHVFTGIKGGAFDSGNLARAVRWHAIRDQIATFPDSEPLRFHDLRHTALTWFVRLGAAPDVVQRVAGHASVTTTELYTRSSSRAAALALRDLASARNREVAPAAGGEVVETTKPPINRGFSSVAGAGLEPATSRL